ncbi:MAG: DUF938 domain-containing protein [Pseudobacteriovorax sp.]|nr:DUF938 domain-containing protein [Pseudobacteriovorax sp.]
MNFSPAAERNKSPIWDILSGKISDAKLALEIASGTGQHALFFASHSPSITWQPSDMSDDNFTQIDMQKATMKLPNVNSPIIIDCEKPDTWPSISPDLILVSNMIHISPWEATKGLFTLSGRLLLEGKTLCTYGPFIQEGVETAPSNLSFDQSLRSRNPAWGIRNLTEVQKLAQEHGFSTDSVHNMPANNLLILFKKQ